MAIECANTDLKKKLHYSEVLRNSNSRVKYGEQYETIDIFN